MLYQNLATLHLISGLPVCCIATWMVVMSLTTGMNASWDVTESDYIWIILGPMIGVILVSLI